MRGAGDLELSFVEGGWLKRGTSINLHHEHIDRFRAQVVVCVLGRWVGGGVGGDGGGGEKGGGNEGLAHLRYLAVPAVSGEPHA